MNAAARRSFLKAHEQTQKARQCKLAGDPQSAALALSDARWYRERAKCLESGK